MKLKFITAGLTLLLTGYLQAQTYQLTNVDTVKKIHSEFFRYFNSHAAVLDVKIVKNAMNKKPSVFIYRTFDSFQELYIATIHNPYVQDILSRDFSDSAIISTDTVEFSIKFIESDTKKYKKLGCFFDFYPLISFGNFIYLKTVCLSKGIDKDELRGEIHLVFNRNLEIVYNDYANKFL